MQQKAKSDLWQGVFMRLFLKSNISAYTKKLVIRSSRAVTDEMHKDLLSADANI